MTGSGWLRSGPSFVECYRPPMKFDFIPFTDEETEAQGREVTSQVTRVRGMTLSQLSDGHHCLTGAQTAV